MKKAMLFGGLQAQNTFIGGIGATINTASLLASKLGISVSRISNFEVVGSEVRCRIFGNYAIPLGCFEGVIATNNNAGIRSYLDGGLVTSISAGAFYSNQQQMLIQNIEFENVLTVGDYAFFGGGQRSFIKTIILKNCTSFLVGQNCASLPDLESCYIPRVTTLGATVGNNNVFIGVTSKLTIYAHPSLATNNAGAPDGDLQAAIALGATVIYVTNFDKPSIPTFTLTGGVYGTAIQINNIVCTSTNAIDYYEVWINGQDSGQRITGTSGFATNLIVNTSYDIQLVARDIFFNESEISAVSTASTKSVYADILTNLKAYYKLNSNITDTISAINGTNYGGTFTTGKVGNALTLNGTSQYATLPDNDVFSFCDGSGDKAFSVGLFAQFDGTGIQILFDKREKVTAPQKVEYTCYFASNRLYFRKVNENNDDVYVNISVAFTPTLGQKYFIAITSDGNYVNDKIYIDAISLTTTVFVDGAYVKMANTTSIVTIGKQGYTGGNYFNGKIDVLSFHDKELSVGEISDMSATYNLGNDLI